MASPRNSTCQELVSTSTPETMSPNSPSLMDTLTNEQLQNFNSLTKPLEDLTLAARQCYNSRRDYDMESDIFKLRDQERESKLLANETHLGDIQKQVVDLRRRRQEIGSRLPPHLLTSIDPSLADLEAALLLIEQQKLLGILGMIGHVDTNIVRAQYDLRDVQDGPTRAALKGPLEKLQDALWDVQSAYDQYGGPRALSIERDLVWLQSRGHGKSEPDSSPLSSDKTDDHSDVSSLDLNAPGPSSSSHELPVGEQQHQHVIDDNEDRVFRFDPDDCPSLWDICYWLNQEDSVSTALLLMEKPIDGAFAAYRSSSSATTTTNNPKRLKSILPLFTYSRHSLQQWRDSVNLKQKVHLDFSAALFAHQVVRFLEGSSCEEVGWEPVFDNKDKDKGEGFENLRGYEIGRRRWAIALQILWFLEITLS
ncbi:hypothetical protein HD806DRAFT_71362 [Xylariaceae sp. AK1471]|nr:hypothetical protein HD806DRAFT_71362 [Xylariaceae sp. AK1471]